MLTRPKIMYSAGAVLQQGTARAARGGGTGSCLRRRGLGRFMGVSGGIKNNCEVPKIERL